MFFSQGEGPDGIDEWFHCASDSRHLAGKHREAHLRQAADGQLQHLGPIQVWIKPTHFSGVAVDSGAE